MTRVAQTEFKLVDFLNDYYRRYNRREFVHPDPLEFLYDYENIRDREIAGLIASSLAYGRVSQILNSVASILDRMPSPYEFLMSSSKKSLEKMFCDFKHRFTTGDELANLLYGVKRAIETQDSVENCFMAGFSPDDETVIPALCNFVDSIETFSGRSFYRLLPHPCRGSACKRLNLFLRWMVREDDVDPGGWYNISPSRLVVPLDTHLYRISKSLGLTKRNSADLASALEITEAFREIAPDDPVKFDFALTRQGIRNEKDLVF